MDGKQCGPSPVPDLATLQAGLASIRLAPAESGMLELIVRRPAAGRREVLESAEITCTDGLVGDRWRSSGSPRKPADPDVQLTLMNARAIALIAGDRARWPLAGDQLFVDFDLSQDNLPPGTFLAIGDTVVVRVSAEPHTGCGIFIRHFGVDAQKFVNSAIGRQLNLRGINARVIHGGLVRRGQRVNKLQLVLRRPRLDEESEVLRAHRATSPAFPHFLHYYEEGMPFRQYLERLEEQAQGLNLPPRFVPATFLFAFLGDRIVGRTSIRHQLNPFLERVGGHIGYAVVPEFRGQGHATAILRLSLEIARDRLGLRRVLVTCDDDNLASIRVIEKNGGVLENVVSGPDLEKPKRRYWIDSATLS